MVSETAIAVLCVFLTVHSTQAYDLISAQRLGLGRPFCGLDDPDSRTYNLPKFIPLIKATKPPQRNYLFAARDTSWFCQTPFGDIRRQDEPQFITFYDTKNKLPVYSIYKVDKTWAPGGERTNTLPRVGGFETATQVKMDGWKAELPSKEAFTNSGFDRGHLFADNYAQDSAQKKATYRITNAVAQDPRFNEHQWKTAETRLLKTGMFRCKHPEGDTENVGGTPYILTGAVSGREGFQETTYQIEYEQNGESHVMKVPTHMWTTMLCLNRDGNEISHMSFIGSNYQEGQVVFYPNFQHFASDLKEMYGETGNVFQSLPFQPQDGAYALPPADCGTGELVCTDNSGPRFQRLSDFSVPAARAKSLINNLLSSMKVTGHDITSVFKMLKEQSGMSISQIAVNLMTHLDEQEASETFAEIIVLSKTVIQAVEVELPNQRKKRDISTETESPQNNTYLLLKVKDSDPARDLKLSECTLTELDSNTTLAIDKHTIDIEKMRHFEGKDGGPTVTVKKMMPNGTETIIPKSVLKEQIINIVLSPRRTP